MTAKNTLNDIHQGPAIKKNNKKQIEEDQNGSTPSEGVPPRQI